MSHRSTLLLSLFLGIVVFGLATAGFYRTVVDLSTPYPEDVPLYERAGSAALGDTVHVGVISRYPPSVIYSGYQPLLDYLTESTGRYFALRLSGSYEETVRQLVDGRVAVAFLGAYLYLKAHAEHGILSVVQPLNDDGTPGFRSALITSQHSEITSISDLAGRRLALPPELSFSAVWLLMQVLPSAELDVASVGSARYLPHHHAVVYEVLRGHADAGVVKDRVAREFLGRGVRVVATSDPIPGGPLVVPAEHDPELVEAITRALLAIDPAKPEFASRTARWDPEFAHGFVVARDSDYDGLRAMLGLLPS